MINICMTQILLPEKEIVDEYLTGSSNRSLSIKYHTNQRRIKNILIKHKIPTRNISQSLITRTFTKQEVKNIIRLYLNEHYTRHDLAILYNCKIATIRTILNKQNNIFKNHSNPNIQSILFKNKENIIKLYNKYKIIKPISKYYNCSDITIIRFLDSINISRKKYNSIKSIPICDIDKLSILHYEKMMSLKEIAKIYNVSPPTMRTFFDKNHIPRRNHSETSAINAQNPLSIEKGRKSMLTHKRYVLPSGEIIKLQGYEPLFLDYIFENKLLEENEIDYNPKRIEYFTPDNKKHYYFPDFYIPKFNLIIEIKSTWILHKQNPEIVELKKNYTIKNGFAYMLILDNNFEKCDDVLNNYNYEM